MKIYIYTPFIILLFLLTTSCGYTEPVTDLQETYDRHSEFLENTEKASLWYALFDFFVKLLLIPLISTLIIGLFAVVIGFIGFAINKLNFKMGVIVFMYLVTLSSMYLFGFLGAYYIEYLKALNLLYDANVWLIGIICIGSAWLVTDSYYPDVKQDQKTLFEEYNKSGGISGKKNFNFNEITTMSRYSIMKAAWVIIPTIILFAFFYDWIDYLYRDTAWWLATLFM